MGAVSRRRFLGLTAGAAGAAGGALLLATAGCAGPGGASAAPDDLSKGRNTQLRIDNWADYIDSDEPDAPGTVRRFEAATGIKVTYDEQYGDNLTALADGGVIHQLQQGNGSGLRRHRPHLLGRQAPHRPGAPRADPPGADPQPRQRRPAVPRGPLGPRRPLAHAVAGRPHRDRLGPGGHRREAGHVGGPAGQRSGAAGPGRDGHRDAGGRRPAPPRPGAGPGPGDGRPGPGRPRRPPGDREQGAGQVLHRLGVRRAAPQQDVRRLPGLVGRRRPDPGHAPRSPVRHSRRGRHPLVRQHDHPQGRRVRAGRRRLDELRLQPGQRRPDHRRRPVREPGDRRPRRPHQAGRRGAALANNPILFPDGETRRRLFFWSGLDEATEDELQERFDSITGPLVYQS